MSERLSQADMSPEQAYAFAGIDGDFDWFKIYTHPFRDAEGHEGQYEVWYSKELIALEQSSDPKGLLMASVKAQLIKCLKETKLPLDAWIVEFSPVMERYQVPSHLFLNRSEDRLWLV